MSINAHKPKIEPKVRELFLQYKKKFKISRNKYKTFSNYVNKIDKIDKLDYSQKENLKKLIRFHFYEIHLNS